MPAINAIEQQHMYAIYGVLYSFRCDDSKCRKGFHDVLNTYNAVVLGGHTYCLSCKEDHILSKTDTVEWIPKMLRPTFLGKKDNPEVPESWTHCGDCNAVLRPTEHNLAACYIIVVNRIRKAVCHTCYDTKYKLATPSRQRSVTTPTTSAKDVEKMEKMVLETIRMNPKKKWNVGVLFEAIGKEYGKDKLIREAVRNLRNAGTLLFTDHQLTLSKKQVQ
jgi:hypothetical protein